MEAPISPVPTIATRRSGTSRVAGVAGDARPAHELGDAEGEVERLPRVQPWVAERHVARAQLLLEDGLGAAEALGHVLAGELQMNAPGPHALAAAGGEEPLDLAHDRVEAPRLHARLRLEDV